MKNGECLTRRVYNENGKYGNNITKKKEKTTTTVKKYRSLIICRPLFSFHCEKAFKSMTRKDVFFT